MPSYAGFKDLRDYLEQRAVTKQVSFNELSSALGFTHTYIAGIATGAFSPSRSRADAIAKYFGDPPRVIRVLAGLELPPTDEDETVSAIREIAVSLPASSRRELLRYARFLQEQGGK